MDDRGDRISLIAEIIILIIFTVCALFWVSDKGQQAREWDAQETREIEYQGDVNE